MPPFNPLRCNQKALYLSASPNDEALAVASIIERWDGPMRQSRKGFVPVCTLEE